MSDASGFNPGGDSGAGLADIDHRHRFTTGFGYDLPFGKGKPFASGAPAAVDKVIGGWAIQGSSPCSPAIRSP